MLNQHESLMNDDKKLTICMPALNEAEHIEKTLTEIYCAAKEILYEFEIIIIDDGSTDDTYKIACLTQQKLGHEIIVIRKERNEGLGPALKTSIERAKYKNITNIVSDGAFSIEGIKRIFLSVGKAPVIIGYRENFSSRPLKRKILSSCITQYVNFITGKKLIDAQGIIVTQTEYCKKISTPFARYNSQMQIACFSLRLTDDYLQVPVIYSHSADLHSSMLKWRVYIDVLKSALKLLPLKFSAKQLQA